MHDGEHARRPRREALSGRPAPARAVRPERIARRGGRRAIRSRYTNLL